MQLHSNQHHDLRVVRIRKRLYFYTHPRWHKAYALNLLYLLHYCTVISVPYCNMPHIVSYTLSQFTIVDSRQHRRPEALEP